MQLKRTKIVCTVGPSCWDEIALTNLAKAGMNVARLNFSHGTQEQKLEEIKLIRKISEKINKPIAIMADLQGPKLRLGRFEGTRDIRKGDIIQLSLNPVEDELPIQFDLTPFVKKGHRLFLNDGLVELIVQSTKNKTIVVKAVNLGWVSSNKGINIPDTHLKGAAITSKDYEDGEFAIEQGVDYISLSYVQTVNEIKVLKDLINKRKSKARLISKIEKAEAIVHLEEIIAASDAVMVARGDLAIETKAEEVPILQEKIIRLARQYYKPVIVATQMLESMIENPRPTRAEVSDVANAVLHQADAVMLSAESASGRYPVEAVKIMKEVILSVEEHPEYKEYIRIDWDKVSREELAFSAIASSAAQLAYRINAKLIVVATATGRAARYLSSFRPSAPIYAVTHDEQTANQLTLVWGVKSTVVKPTVQSDTFLKNIIDSINKESFESNLKEKFIKKGDKVVFISGSKIGVSGGTDTIKVLTF